MQRHRVCLTFVALLVPWGLGAEAQQDRPQPAQAPAAQQAQAPLPQSIAVATPRVKQELPTVELAPVLQRVARAANKRFLVDGRVAPQIYLAGVEPSDVTYPVLLSILRANGLGAVEIEGRVNIMPDSDIRFQPTPIVQNDDATIAADEYVTRIVTITNTDTGGLIPILRPLLSQAAHLAAMVSSNRIVIMDRYANVKRITEIIRSLDVPARD